MKKLIIPIILVAAMLGQAPPSSRKQPAPAKSGVDTIIELVQGGASESTVIKSLRSQGTIYRLSPDDLLKLQKAGVSESIINVMTDPKTSVAPVAPSSVQQPAPAKVAAAKDPLPTDAAAPATDTPYPPDLQTGPVLRKRRMIVGPFRYAHTKAEVQYYFNRDEDIGDGIRSMVVSQVGNSESITLLERRDLDLALREQNFALTGRAKGGQGPGIGKVLGADYFLVGEVVGFGVASTEKKQEGGTWQNYANSWLRSRISIPVPGIATFTGLSKEDRASVIIDFRIVDAETLETVSAGFAKGESLHKAKQLQAGLWGQGSVQSFGSSTMTSPDFQKTLLGEATTDAVNKIAKQLEEKGPQIPLKPRKIEGRIAKVTDNGVYLAVGSDDGVMVGDRFEVRRIDNEVLDPQTKDRIALEAVKVGELVVTDISDKHASFGNYGGQPLSADYVIALGKGYQARLISK